MENFMKNQTKQAVSGVVTDRDDEGLGKTPMSGGIRIQKSVLIDRPAETLYAFWSNFVNFPFFMEHVIEVSVSGDTHSHWVVKAPAGQTVEWDAVVIEAIPNERISWRSAEEADVDNAGSVAFRPAVGGRGTQVTVTLTYNPPAGKVGHWIAILYGEEPAIQLSQDLRRFKALMETGEVPTGAMRREDVAVAAQS
jgi:uncharacterized membrane protein